MTFPVFATGDVLNASDMNAVGMWLVKSQTISNGVSSVTVTNAFSTNYDAYQIVVSGGGAGGDYGLNLRLGSTNTGYYFTGEYRNFANTVNNVIFNNNASEFGAVGIATTNTLQANIFINQPFLTKNTYFSAPYIYGSTAGGQAHMAGFLDNNISYTDFTLFMYASTFSGGTIRIYGLRN